jgi:hypothetical protein
MLICFILVWVAFAVIAAGFAYAAFTATTKENLKLYGDIPLLDFEKQDFEDAWIVGAFGPIGLIMLVSRVETAKYGWINPFKKV